MTACHRGARAAPCRMRGAILALAAALICGPAAAESMRFSVHVGGIYAGEMRLDAENGPAGYALDAHLTASRLVRTFTDIAFRGQARGRKTAEGRLVPASFASVSRQRGVDRIVRMRYENGVPVAVETENFASPPTPLPEAQTRGTVDPVTATWWALRARPAEAVCDGSLELYDGRRRTRVSLGPPSREGDRMRCTGRYERIAGDSHSVTRNQSDFDFTLVFRPAGNGLMEIERFQTVTMVGTAIARRID